MKHYIDFHRDVSFEDLDYLLDTAIDLKAKTKAGIEHHLLKGKTLAMIFTKSSTRTRVSFEGHLTSQTFAGKPYSDIYPEFRGIVDNECEDLPYEEVAKDSDLVITALPHGVSAKIVPTLLAEGVKVIDHSGDFRYKDLATYEKSYKLTHPNPDLLKDAVYGLPEFYREQLKTANLVANPGCYPTCSLIALAPFLKDHLIKEDSIIIDATSGVSGAGRKADLAYAFCELDESFKPYGAVGHRHTTEISEQCSFLAGKNPHQNKTC